MNSDLLRTFVTIADCGNLTLAAGRLGRTQSAVSVQLRNLEDSLGVRLFAREARGMRLTEHGERLLPRARSLVRDIGEVSRFFDRSLAGQIRIGIPDDYEDGRIERILSDFAVRHPGVEVRISSGCTSGYPDAIRDGTLDIAVCSGPGMSGGQALSKEDIVWAAGDTSSAAGEDCVPLAVLDRDCWWGSLPQDALTAAGRDYRIAFSSSSFPSVCAAVSAGLAVAILPASQIGDRMRPLGAAQGFPALPSLCRTILAREGGPHELVDAVRTALLRHSF